MAVYSPKTLRKIEIEDLFRYNYRPLCMYALHYLQDSDLVEDVVQECFTTLWEKLEQGVRWLTAGRIFMWPCATGALIIFAAGACRPNPSSPTIHTES